mmetsp:Transcript_43730/g.76710  ORF Transcript_43730/g.76710 Transcript_43730/m.76710 type:complete len:297 (+) Transcript_43730:210-1100(+)
MSSCRHQKRTTSMTTNNHKVMGSDSCSINACRCRRSQLKPLKWLQQVINAWSAVTSYAICCKADPTVIIWCVGYGDVGIMSKSCTETPPWSSSEATANTSPSARRSKLPRAPADWDWLSLVEFLLACAADLERLAFKNCLGGVSLTRAERFALGSMPRWTSATDLHLTRLSLPGSPTAHTAVGSSVDEPVAHMREMEDKTNELVPLSGSLSVTWSSASGAHEASLASRRTKSSFEALPVPFPHRAQTAGPAAPETHAMSCGRRCEPCQPTFTRCSSPFGLPSLSNTRATMPQPSPS